jgi:hypothetical protein
MTRKTLREGALSIIVIAAMTLLPTLVRVAHKDDPMAAVVFGFFVLIACVLSVLWLNRQG